MSNDYDVAPDVDLTNAQESDDFDAHVIDSITRKNTYRNFSKLTMKVVSPPIMVRAGTLPEANGTNLRMSPVLNIGQQIMFRGRILGDQFLSPHQLLEDPCNITKFTGNDEALTNIINQHTLCVSKYDYQGGPLNIGDLVSVSYSPGDAGPIDLQYCYFDSIEQITVPEKIAAFQDGGSCTKLSDLFGAGLSGVYSFPEISWSLEDKPETNEFYEKLKNSAYFSGFSENFLWGLTANAIAESGLVSNIGGDPESVIGKREYPPIKNFCSFGYWQLNLCSAGAEGDKCLSTDKAEFVIRHYKLKDWREKREGFNESVQESIFQYITNENIQFEYVSNRMKDLFPNDWSNSEISAYDAAYKICVNFERPVDKEQKGVERGNLAKELQEEHSRSSTT